MLVQMSVAEGSGSGMTYSVACIPRDATVLIWWLWMCSVELRYIPLYEWPLYKRWTFDIHLTPLLGIFPLPFHLQLQAISLVKLWWFALTLRALWPASSGHCSTQRGQLNLNAYLEGHSITIIPFNEWWK